MTTDFDDLRAVLEATVGWENLTAYERTKHCCVALLARGVEIPNWNVLRKLIGKGGAADIQRAIKDFKREYLGAIRQLFFYDGVPETLAPYILGFWKEAVAEARQGFADQLADWRMRIEQAESARAAAEAERDQAISLLNEQHRNERAAWEQSIAQISARLLRAETQADRLSAENSRLVSSLEAMTNRPKRKEKS